MSQHDNERDNGARRIRDYVSDRMREEVPPDFVGGVMNEVRQTPQRARWSVWPAAAALATVAGAVAIVGIGLSLVDRPGVGSGSPTPVVSAVESADATPSPQPSSSPVPTPAPSVVPVARELDPEQAFETPASCENMAGLPTQEYGENVAWRIWYPADWFTTEGYLGPCMLFGPEPWEQTLEPPVPDEVAIEIHVIDQAVTPGQHDYAGGTVLSEEEFTISGMPAIRYELAPSGGDVLGERSVVWVIGIAGTLPALNDVETPNFLTVVASSDDAATLSEWADVLDRMVATLEVL